jgi:tripartite-type tricarboxylate transporter receptor subunit TctC
MEYGVMLKNIIKTNAYLILCELGAASGKAACVVSILACAAVGGTVAAQSYPAKPVRFIVPFTAGGPNDSAIRPLSQKLQELLGQPFIVDYRAGANGIIGSEYVAKSPPDGYTLLVISSSFAINTAMYAKLPFDPSRDFAAVSSIATGDILFVINPVVPARTVKDFVALARATPGKLAYASSGVGGSLHLGAELLSFTSGIKMVHVPYKGAILALTDVIGGHVDAMFVAGPAAIPQVKAGKVRALAVASRRRAPLLPDLPTFAEAGFPGVEVDSRYGILAPAAMPRESLTRLNAAIVKSLGTPDVRERYVTMGMEAASSTPQEYADHLRDEMVKLKKVVAAAKLPLQ